MSVASALMFVFSLLMLPWLLGKIPADYFVRPRDPVAWHVLLQPQTILRNLLGLPLLLAGIVMLVGPGQGILTILVALGIMNFPGKFTLERWIVTRKGVLMALNWLRTKAKHRPLEI